MAHTSQERLGAKRLTLCWTSKVTLGRMAMGGCRRTRGQRFALVRNSRQYLAWFATHTNNLSAECRM